MVHRRLARGAALLVCLAALAWPGTALATNTRVTISNYEWSIKEVHINLDEKVDWEWLGPDLMHSVTGVSPNAVQWDSDPGTDAPIAFATNNTFSGYVGVAGSYTIPLSASYVQTGARVTPGTANAGVVFTLTYQ